MERKLKLSEYFFLPFRVIYKMYFLLFFVFSLILIFPLLYYFLHDAKRFPKAFLLMRFYSSTLLFFTGVILKIKGAENIPKKGAYIICSNHTSFLDAFCIYSIFKQYFVFVGKKEIEKWPLFHIAYTSGMNILVDRNSKTGSVKAMKRMLNEIDNGNPLVMFPEGTISKNLPQPGPFKPGAFTIAIQKQVPVLPITFRSNWKRLERSGMWKGKAGPGIAEVIIHKPISTVGLNKEHIDQLQNQVRSTIISSL